MSHHLFDRVERVLYAVAALSVLLIVVFMIGRVVSRNFNLDWAGLQEYAQLTAVWLTFLVVGNLARDREHIEVDYFSKRLPDRVKPYHDVLVSLLNLGIAVVVLLGAFIAIQNFWDSTSPSVGLPIPLYYAAPVVGFGFLTLVWMRQLYVDVRAVLPAGVQARLPGGGVSKDE